MVTKTSRPNIVFTIADDQRHSAVGGLDMDAVHTPNQDALLERGTCLRQAYVMGSTIPAVCAPSRGMLHTGRSLFHIPPVDLSSAEDWPRMKTLGRQLRDSGYHTHGVGKWHNGKPAFADAFDSGGHITFGGMWDHFNVPVFDYETSGQYDNANAYIGKQHSTPLFADAAVDFLNRYDEQEPFFLYVAFTAPHDPRTPRPEFASMYDPENIDLPPNFLPRHPFDNGEMQIRDEQLAPWPRTESRMRQEIADYYAMVSDLDEGLGRVHRALRTNGLEENTLVIHTADHGLAVGQHGLLGKQNLYDHSMRVPLMIAGPGVPRGAQREGLCYMPDLMPTLLERAGLAVGDDVQWQTLEGLIQGEDDAGREQIFAAYMDRQRMVRDRRYKLIEYFPPAERRTQLFDLDHDPWEMNDISEQPNQADRVEDLRSALSHWQQRVDDPIL